MALSVLQSRSGSPVSKEIGAAAAAAAAASTASVASSVSIESLHESM